MSETFQGGTTELLEGMPIHWERLKLKRLFDVKTGATPLTKEKSYWDGEIVWITPADYKTRDVYVARGERTITQAGYNASSTTLVPAGSIIFSKRAPIGSIAIASNELCTSQGCLGCVPKVELNSLFYYYFLRAATPYITSMAGGTTFKEISRDTFAECDIPVPPLEEQNRIAEYLQGQSESLDRQEDIIHSLMLNLLEYRKAIISETVTRGFSEGPFQNLEWCPTVTSQWETRKLKYLVKNKTSKAESKKNYIGLENLVSWRAKRIGKSIVPQSQVTAFSKGDVLFGKLRPYLAKALNAVEDGCCTTELLVFSVDNSEILNSYLLYVLLSADFIEYVNKSCNGAKMPRTNWNYIKEIAIPLPSLEEQAQIVDFLDNQCSSLDEQENILQELLNKIGEYRQSLITEAVTGRLVGEYQPQQQQRHDYADTEHSP